MNKMKIILPLVFIAILSIVVYSYMNRRTDSFRASGTLEARNISVGSKEGGRVAKVLIKEGDAVKTGQILITFEDSQLAAIVQQNRGEVAQARAQLDKMLHGNRPEEIAQAQAAAHPPTGIAGFLEEDLRAAHANAEKAKADLADAQVTYDRTKQLVAAGVYAQQLLDDAAARLKIAQATLDNANHTVVSAEGRLRQASAAQKLSESGFRKEDIDSARANLEAAQGALALAESRYAERQVVSPADAVVEVMDMRPGDLLLPNATVAKLLEAQQLYVVVYVPQSLIGHVQVGAKATIKVDAFPNERFDAVVEQIRQQAEFLPRNVQTADEREHQVVGVKIRVMNPGLKLRAGIAADVEFSPEQK